MREATRRMQALISDLLTYSRVATRGQRFTAVDMNETVRGVLSDLEVRIRETQAVVEVTELPTVVADPTQMRQLLQNLIGNALKFHKEGEPPRVRVSAEPDQPDEGTPGGSSVRIVVQDSGIGFDEKYAERIFGLFQRLNPRHAYDGSGIGLAVCRRIAERHGGTVTAHSNPGEGTRFIVCLPLKHETREQEV
jgi:signal transduction histidine kinase